MFRRLTILVLQILRFIIILLFNDECNVT